MILMKGRNSAVVVINKDARQGNHAEALLRSPIRGAIQVVRSYVVAGNLIATTLREELQKGTRTFIVGGGDGTINVAVNVLAYSGVSLGILPLGTTNNFARSLGLPLNPEEAIKVISRQNLKKIHLGRVNDRYFTSVAILGVSAQAVNKVSPGVKAVAGRAAYAVAGLKQVAMQKPFNCVISSEDKRYSLKTNEVLIANGSHHAALEIAPEASIMKKHLFVKALGTSQSRMEWASALLRLPTNGSSSRAEEFELSLQKFTLTARPGQAIAADGEIVAQTPAEFSVAIGAMKVFVS